MKQTPGVVLALFVWTVSSSPVWAWGLDGHRIIGMIADILLTNGQSGASVNRLLDGATLSEAATWADCAKGYCGRARSEDEQAYVAQNPQHNTYHYTDVPILEPRYQLGMAGTRNNDVVQVTKQAINVIRGRAPNNGPAILDRKSALWVMAHMVGDLHQPLHVGAIYFADDCSEQVDPNSYEGPITETKGGNYLMLSKRENLHHYWDDGTVIGAMRLAGASNEAIKHVRSKAIEDFANYVVAHPPNDWKIPGDVETWPEQWASEILPLANAAYKKVQKIDGVHAVDEPEGGLKCTWQITLSPEYTAWANNQALNQLGKAGFRLAAVIAATMQRE